MSAPRPPRSETELARRADALAGISLGELAAELGDPVPRSQRRAKGWAGQLIERALGASAGSKPEPDFQIIGVELKTLPVSAHGRPTESTYVCTVPLDSPSGLRWETSNVLGKLARVLWVPLEADRAQPLAARRIGRALLWSPSQHEEQALRRDWEEFIELIALGRVDEISAHHGQCLQIRPKAANARSRTLGVDAGGVRAPTLPRGFYLRTAFTASILRAHYAGTLR